MRKRRTYAALGGAALFVLAGASYALAQASGDTNVSGTNSKREKVHSDTLNGYQETPGVSTTGFGTFEAVIDDETQTITYELTYAALETPAAQAHIHFGNRWNAGGVSVFLCGGGDKPPCPPIAGTVTGVIDPSDVIGPANQGIEPGAMAELIRAIRAGQTYVNVHTSRFPAGEIRGQIVDNNQRQPQ